MPGNLLFTHDHRFAVSEDGSVYSTTGSFSSATWSRYLEHFSTVTVFARLTRRRANRETDTLASVAGVEFRLQPEFASARGMLMHGKAVWRELKREVLRADAIVARLPSELGLAAISLAKSQGKTYAVEVVGCSWDACINHGRAVARLYAPFAFYRMRRAVRAAPFALYVTREWLQRRYHCHGFTASASNVEIVTPDVRVRSSRNTRQITLARGRRPVLGTIASLVSQYKGIETAIKALKELSNAGIRLEYRVLGAGDRSGWQKIAKQHGVEAHVRFEGVLPAGEAVRGWLDDIDIYLQPSLTEGLPRGLIEAMSRGCACVGSNAGGMAELLPPDRRHAPGDYIGLFTVIEHLVRHPERIQFASEAGFALAGQYDREILKSARTQFYRLLSSEACD